MFHLPYNFSFGKIDQKKIFFGDLVQLSHGIRLSYSRYSIGTQVDLNTRREAGKKEGG